MSSERPWYQKSPSASRFARSTVRHHPPMIFLRVASGFFPVLEKRNRVAFRQDRHLSGCAHRDFVRPRRRWQATRCPVRENPEATRKKSSADGAARGTSRSATRTAIFWYQGRSDDMFKSAGYRIGPSEIENCLVKHPAVANCAVVGSPDSERTHIVKAFIVLTPATRPRRRWRPSCSSTLRGKLAALRVIRGNRVSSKAADDQPPEKCSAGCCGCEKRKERGGAKHERRSDRRGRGHALHDRLYPQVWRIWKTRSARDLSLPMYLIFTAGVALWFVYGLLLGAVPIIVCNGSTLLLAGTVLAMKLKFG